MCISRFAGSCAASARIARSSMTGAVCDRYLDRLIQEIHLVGGQLPGRKRVTSLYFGGGTPALAAGR